MGKKYTFDYEEDYYQIYETDDGAESICLMMPETDESTAEIRRLVELLNK